MKTGRNDPCPCGSGKKYKQCCLGRNQQSSFTLFQKLLAALFALLFIGGLIGALQAFRSGEPDSGPGLVWSEEHQHWH